MICKKGEMEIFSKKGKMFLECNMPSGKVRIAEIIMPHRTDSVQDAKEIFRRWNSQPYLREACKKAFERN